MCHLSVQQCFQTVASTAESVGCCALVTRVQHRLRSHPGTARRMTDLRHVRMLGPDADPRIGKIRSQVQVVSNALASSSPTLASNSKTR